MNVSVETLTDAIEGIVADADASGATGTEALLAQEGIENAEEVAAEIEAVLGPFSAFFFAGFTAALRLERAENHTAA
jgi:hypothetical protein